MRAIQGSFLKPFLESGDVPVDAPILLVSLHVVAFDEPFNAPLDHLRVGRELDAQDLGALSD